MAIPMWCELDEFPAFDELDDTQKLLLTLWWSISDAETPTKQEMRPLLGYSKALEDIARIADKRVKPPIDTGVGTGLPSHRQVRVRAA